MAHKVLASIVPQRKKLSFARRNWRELECIAMRKIKMPFHIVVCVSECISRSNPKIIKYKFSRAHGQAHRTPRVQIIITTIYFKDDCWRIFKATWSSINAVLQCNFKISYNLDLLIYIWISQTINFHNFKNEIYFCCRILFIIFMILNYI